MLGLPRPLIELTHQLSRLPGIGPKAAERLALALLGWEPTEVSALSAALGEAVARVTDCAVCGCLSQDNEPCAVCADGQRERGVLCVVEQALDAIAVERGEVFQGVYHVLGGVLSPMRGVLPEDLRINELLTRVKAEGVREVIVATNASPDGEATALYLKQELAPTSVQLTRLARGLPSGSQLDYADMATMQSALEHRTEL